MNFVFDLDGTITSEELLPRIADAVGIASEMAELTRLTMQGVIPFEHSFRERVRMLQMVPVSTVMDIVSQVSIDPAIAKFLFENKERCTIVTGNLDVWIAPLCKRLGPKHISSTAAVEHDFIIEITQILDKAEAARQMKAPFVAIGDGHNDIGLFEHAKISIAYGGVHHPAASLARLATHAIYDAETLCQFLRQL